MSACARASLDARRGAREMAARQPPALCGYQHAKHAKVGNPKWSVLNNFIHRLSVKEVDSRRSTEARWSTCAPRSMNTSSASAKCAAARRVA